MRKSLCSIVLYILCVLFSLSLWGQKKVNIEQAEKVAENIASSFSSGKIRGSKPKLNLVYTSTKSGANKLKTLTANDEVYYYVFNVNTDDGFVVVSGNDIAIPVLGYSNEGGYNEKDIPPALAWWMDQYKQEIQYALDHNMLQDKETKAKWADFTNGSSQSISPKTGNRSSYTPGTNLVKATWNQSSPYNDLVKSKLGNYPTGCGATAIAQLMHYWKYPAKILAPIPGYTTNSLKLNVSGVATGTPIDWANMTDSYSYGSYTPIQAKAVAELMYYVGVAHRMDYNSGGSSSYVSESEKALMNYFGYNAKWIDKRNHLANWDGILKAQIDALQPVKYSGFDSKNNVGHAFICDGYQYQNGTLYFHFNWGWGGSGNNYCATSALIPDPYGYNFSNSQTIVIDVKPKTIDSNSPTNLTTTNITTSGAQLNWNPVNGALNYTVEYKEPITSTWNIADATTAVSYTLSDLTANTVYDWRVKANYSSFSSDYTQAYFTTNICIAPMISWTSGITTNSAFVDWNTIEGIQDYTLEYKISTSTEWITAAKTPYAGYTFLKLEPNTTYNWRVKSNCSATSSSDFSRIYSFTTKTEACTSPTVLNTATITANSASLNWNSVSGAQNYTVEYKTSTTSWTVADSSIGSTTYTLSGLTANTTYEWRIKANCSDFSSSSNFTTLTDQLACITNHEPNDTRETAHSIDLNIPYNAGIESARDKDYYKFTLNTASDIIVSLQNLPKDYELQLLNSTGSRIQSSTKGGTADEKISLNSQPAGTYYIYVYGYNGNFDADQCYRLKVSASEDRGDHSIDIENNISTVTLYPNPVGSILYLTGANSGKEIYAEAVIIDRNGRTIKTSKVKVENTISIDVSYLSPDVYYLHILGKNYKFIKK